MNRSARTTRLTTTALRHRLNDLQSKIIKMGKVQIHHSSRNLNQQEAIKSSMIKSTIIPTLQQVKSYN